MGFGMFPTFFFGGSEIPIWLTPKFSIPLVKDKWNVGVGTLFARVTGVDHSSFGLLYGTSTFGSRNNNISIGVGYGSSSKGVGSVPVINISGLTRISQRVFDDRGLLH